MSVRQRSPPERSRGRYQLWQTSTVGVTLSAPADGGVPATDAAGAEVFTSPRALMWTRRTPRPPG